MDEYFINNCGLIFRLVSQIKMSFIPLRNLRSILSYHQCLRYFQQSKRCTVTVTDEYRATTKSRSSLKGAELLRNPALNKVNKR
jgi:hypothetical protein